MDSNFFALISRMRYIARWGLMRNALPENIQEHSHMVAVLAHALGVIRRDIFRKPCDVNALATAALYAGMHLLQGEIIRRRARGIAQQLATFSLHMFPLSDVPKLLPDCPNMETLRLLLCGNYLRNIQIDPLTAMVYLTVPNLRAYGVVQSFIVCPHCGRRTSVVEGAARQCEHCGMGI